MTADGQTAFSARCRARRIGKAGLAILDVASKKILRYMTFTEMVRPLTINHDGSLVYVNVNGPDRLRDWRNRRPARCSAVMHARWRLEVEGLPATASA